MSEYIYRIEQDFTPEVNRIAAQVQRKVDQAALDKAANTLEQFGYVKVLRCRDCEYFGKSYECYVGEKAKPDGFCAWGERRES